MRSTRSCVPYAGSWLLLGKAMHDAGLGVQMGFLGWRAVWRGEPPRYGPMPEQGLFRWCRQPVYLALALTLWTVPYWWPRLPARQLQNWK